MPIFTSKMSNPTLLEPQPPPNMSRFAKLQKRTNDCKENHDKLQEMSQQEENFTKNVILSRATEKMKQTDGHAAGCPPKIKSSQVCVKPNGFYEKSYSEMRIPEVILKEEEDPNRGNKLKNIEERRCFERKRHFDQRKTSDYHSFEQQNVTA